MPCCGGLTPTAPTQPPAHFPLPWEREKTERRGEDSRIETDSLKGEAKAAGTSKAKEEFIHYFPSARQVFSHFPESRASAPVRVTRDDKCQNHKYHTLPPPFPRVFIAEHGVRWYGVSLGSGAVSCPSCVRWLYLLGEKGCRGGTRDSLDAAQALLSNS